MKPIVVGIGGGSGSGKTTLTEDIINVVGKDSAEHLRHDSYYKDRSRIPPEKRSRINYDHPDALETSLLVTDLNRLLEGTSVEVPVYDFAQHIRMKERVLFNPKPVILVEGIATLVDSSLRDLMDLKIFVDADPDVRFIRRVRRDMIERGRDLESVIAQYMTSVRPMHLKYIEPTKRYADIIISGNTINRVAREVIIAWINNMINSRTHSLSRSRRSPISGTRTN
jgi:uridine kinase